MSNLNRRCDDAVIEEEIEFIFELDMPNQRLIELAIKGLEAEREKVDQEMADLRRQMNGGSRASQRAQGGSESSAASERPTVATNGRSRGSITPAGRKKLAEAARRRWAASRKL